MASVSTARRIALACPEAVEGARLALAMREGSPIATRVLGLALARSGEGRAALRYLSAALAAHPDDAAVRFELARASFESGDDRAVTALYPELEDFMPDQETLGLMVAKAASRSGDPASARAGPASLGSPRPADPAAGARCRYLRRRH